MKDLAYIVHDDGDIITIRVPEGATEENLDGESLYAQVEPLLRDAASPRLLLHDLRRTPTAPVRRRRYVDWVKANRSLVRRSVAAYAVVAKSRVQRGLITAVLWILEPPIPFKAFTDDDAARAWLRSEGEDRRR